MLGIIILERLGHSNVCDDGNRHQHIYITVSTALENGSYDIWSQWLPGLFRRSQAEI